MSVAVEYETIVRRAKNHQDRSRNRRVGAPSVDPALMTNERASLAALLSLGGDLNFIDTEDIAIRADELSPGRFRWRKHKEHIDLGLVRNGLQDAKKRQFARGGALRGWSLTDIGLKEARDALATCGSFASKQRRSAQELAWIARERPRLLTEGALITLRTEGLAAVTDRQLLSFFQLDEYVTGDIRQSRVDRLVRLFEDDPELSPLIKQLANRKP